MRKWQDCCRRAGSCDTTVPSVIIRSFHAFGVDGYVHIVLQILDVRTYAFLDISFLLDITVARAAKFKLLISPLLSARYNSCIDLSCAHLTYSIVCTFCFGCNIRVFASH